MFEKLYSRSVTSFILAWDKMLLPDDNPTWTECLDCGNRF